MIIRHSIGRCCHSFEHSQDGFGIDLLIWEIGGEPASLESWSLFSPGASGDTVFEIKSHLCLAFGDYYFPCLELIGSFFFASCLFVFELRVCFLLFTALSWSLGRDGLLLRPFVS